LGKFRDAIHCEGKRLSPESLGAIDRAPTSNAAGVRIDCETETAQHLVDSAIPQVSLQGLPSWIALGIDSERWISFPSLVETREGQTLSRRCFADLDPNARTENPRVSMTPLDNIW